MKKAIIAGVTSGIGKALAEILSRNGYILGIVGRRKECLEELKRSLPSQVFTRQIDVTETEKAMKSLSQLIEEMQGVDLVIISAGIGFINPDLTWSDEKATIDTNVSGFTAVANVAFHHFERIGTGHLVGISSIAALRGDRAAPAYNASKAFVSNYLEGLRHRAVHTRQPIVVTEIQPGFVDTAMAKGEGLFWVASPEKAARQIYQAIQRKAKPCVRNQAMAFFRLAVSHPCPTAYSPNRLIVVRCRGTGHARITTA